MSNDLGKREEGRRRRRKVNLVTGFSECTEGLLHIAIFPGNWMDFGYPDDYGYPGKNRYPGYAAHTH